MFVVIVWGGAALLLAGMLWKKQHGNPDIRILTYGSPRVASRELVKHLIGIPHQRHVNHDDLVPQIPIQTPFFGAKADKWWEHFYKHRPLFWRIHSLDEEHHYKHHGDLVQLVSFTSYSLATNNNDKEKELLLLPKHHRITSFGSVYGNGNDSYELQEHALIEKSVHDHTMSQYVPNLHAQLIAMEEGDFYKFHSDMITLIEQDIKRLENIIPQVLKAAQYGRTDYTAMTVVQEECLRKIKLYEEFKKELKKVFKYQEPPITLLFADQPEDRHIRGQINEKSFQ